MNFEQHFSEYRRRLINIFDEDLMVQTSVAAEILLNSCSKVNTLFMREWGSAGNAIILQMTFYIAVAHLSELNIKLNH